jgi:hypothetical protein
MKKWDGVTWKKYSWKSSEPDFERGIEYAGITSTPRLNGEPMNVGIIQEIDETYLRVIKVNNPKAIGKDHMKLSLNRWDVEQPIYLHKEDVVGTFDRDGEKPEQLKTEDLPEPKPLLQMIRDFLFRNP